MRILLFVLFVSWINVSYAQDKIHYTSYNKLTDLQGTEFVIATMETMSKLSSESNSLVFINTLTGEKRQMDFPKDASIHKIEQVKIDSLNINKILIAASTVNLDGNKSIDWNDPTQIIVSSPDGTGKTQLTEDSFFVRTWVVNRQTGNMVIIGHYDSNGNGKHDRTDKSHMILYDLKTMKNIKEL